MPGSLKTNGTPVHIFLDMCTEVSKLWGAFDHLKAKLRDGKIDHSLYYPANLTLAIKRIMCTYNIPQAAEDFYNKKIAVKEQHND